MSLTNSMYVCFSRWKGTIVILPIELSDSGFSHLLSRDMQAQRCGIMSV